MRLNIFSALAFIAITSLSAISHAGTYTFVYTPTGNAAITFTLDTAAATTSSRSLYFTNVTTASAGSTHTGATIEIFDATRAESLGYPYAGINFLFSPTPQVQGSNSIYRGNYIFESSATNTSILMPGNYTLGQDTFFQQVGTTGTLSVLQTATPEPSSLILLGTGILGLAGAARRRYSAFKRT